MSTSNQSAGPSTSTDNFTAIFNAASSEYARVTKKRLDTHPFAAQLDACDSPKAVSDLLRTQAHAFSKFRKGDEKLMAILDPTVHILFTFSATLGEGIGLPFSPAKTIFTGIAVLLGAVKDVAASHQALIHLFKRIHLFLQRLSRYIGMPLTGDMTELLGKIMSQVLSILALSTKEMMDRRIKKILKKLAGRTDVEDAVLQLDTLTKEESLMVVVRNLEVAHRVDGNVEATKVLTEDIDDTVKATKALTEDVGGNVKVIDHDLKATKDISAEIKRNQLQEKFRSWLSPPNPSINHNTACEIQHHGTATWFIQGNTFREWMQKGSLLWIRGNPGAGKSILCSAIVEEIKNVRESRSALIGYYYFDYKVSSKRDIRGMLASLLFQLSCSSDTCWDVLHRLYSVCNNGSEQPSTVSLVKCLGDMLKLPGQLPVFVILDALDECPSTAETPSPREKVLDFVEKLVGSGHSNLFICITSRPEQDIQSSLNPLTSPPRRVSLHEEIGQREDIRRYLDSFVHTDRAMRRWKEEDKELVITTLSERAGGMFRWVFCQLDTLRRCMPSSIRKALNELPATLYDTYERALEGIPKEKRQHAHRLFLCLVGALRPLRAEELAELFAIDFDQDSMSNFMEGWRPENPEEAVLSTCSTLISIIDDQDAKIVQFSHFSVKEFLISDRLRTSEAGNIRDYYIPLNAAHATLARACLAVLLQLDKNMDKKRLETFPLASYAAEHWVEHARYEDVASRVQTAMEELFNPTKPHLAAWVWIHDVDEGGVHDLTQPPSSPRGTALYYAALCGFSGVVNYLIITHAEDLDAKSGSFGAPLHAASVFGHYEVVYSLLQHNVDVNITSRFLKWAPLLYASQNGHGKTVQLLLEHRADVNAADTDGDTSLHFAIMRRHPEVVRILLRHGADVHRRGMAGRTPFQMTTTTENQHPEIVQLLLEHGAEKEGVEVGSTSTTSIANA